MVVLAATAVALWLAAGAQPAHAAFGDVYGVNAQDVLRLPESSWDGHINAMVGGGLTRVRSDANWEQVEPAAPAAPGAHRYDWSGLDRQVAALARHGVRWHPIVSYGTTWAGQVPGDSLTPPRVADFAAYANALARRYGRGGSFWAEHPSLPEWPVTRYEIWNEPNAAQFWRPQERAPERYADLYLAARSSLHRVDPAARAIVGGLALSNPGVISADSFIRRMYRHRPDLRGNVDAVGFHPYAATVEGIYAKLRNFRDALTRVGAGEVPIEITEVGWPSNEVDEQHRAAALARLADELPRSDCNVQGVLPYSWVGGEYNPANREHWFGIFRADATPKPSGSAYLSAVQRRRRLGGGSASPQICRPPPLRMRIRRRTRGRPSMVARFRCPEGCRLIVDVRRPVRSRQTIAAAGRRLTRRSLRFSTRRRTIRFRLAPRRRLVLLRATAVARSGAVNTRSRLIRRRCSSSRGRSHLWRCAHRAVKPRAAP